MSRNIFIAKCQPILMTWSPRNQLEWEMWSCKFCKKTGRKKRTLILVFCCRFRVLKLFEKIAWLTCVNNCPIYLSAFNCGATFSWSTVFATFKESISSMFYMHVFRMKFWRQKLQSWNLPRESYAICFCTKKARVKYCWNWHFVVHFEICNHN